MRTRFYNQIQCKDNIYPIILILINDDMILIDKINLNTRLLYLTNLENLKKSFKSIKVLKE